MFKRLFWLFVGMGFGFGASFWMMRALRRAADRLALHRAAEVVAAARRIGAGAAGSPPASAAGWPGARRSRPLPGHRRRARQQAMATRRPYRRPTPVRGGRGGDGQGGR